MYKSDNYVCKLDFMEKSQEAGIFYTFTDKAQHEEEEEVREQPNEEEKPKEEQVHEPQTFEMVYNPRFGVRIPQDRFLRFGKTKKSEPKPQNENTNEKQENTKPAVTPIPIKEPPRQRSPPPATQRPKQPKTEVKKEDPKENTASSLPKLNPRPKTARARATTLRKPVYKRPVLTAREKRKIRQDKLADQVLEHPMVIPSAPKDLTLLLERLQVDLETALDLERYLEVQKISKIMNSAEIKLARAEWHLENQRYLKIANTHNSLCAIAGAKIEEWNQKYDKFAEETKKHIEEVDEKNKQELQEFDQNAPEELPKQYMKAYNRIRKLREKQKIYAMRLDFDKSFICKAAADELEAIDETVLYEPKMRNFLKKREFVCRQLQKKMDAALMHAQSRQFIMIKERENLVIGYGARIIHIEDDLEQHLLRGDFTLDQIEEAKVYDQGESLMLSLRESKTPIKNK